MRGLMMETPLLIPSLLEYAARFHQQTEIVSRTVEGPIHRYSYAEAAELLDIPIGTVMSRIHRARKTLAAQIAEPTGAGT